MSTLSSTLFPAYNDVLHWRWREVSAYSGVCACATIGSVFGAFMSLGSVLSYEGGRGDLPLSLVIAVIAFNALAVSAWWLGHRMAGFVENASKRAAPLIAQYDRFIALERESKHVDGIRYMHMSFVRNMMREPKLVRAIVYLHILAIRDSEEACAEESDVTSWGASQ